ncbi:MAG: PspC domain-containing protein [Lachnospiraceae bacterium]|nr:PspC domain-containing protein [Lachnospiraceae bacterium]
MEPKKLYRSRNDRVIAGICGGLGKFLNLDSTVIRLILAILCIIGGSGLLIYIIAALIIPEEPYM